MTCFIFRIDQLVNLHENERQTLLKKSMKERKHMDKNQDAIEHYLDDVVIALNQRHGNQEAEIKGEYNSIKEDVRNKVHTVPQCYRMVTSCGNFKIWPKFESFHSSCPMKFFVKIITVKAKDIRKIVLILYVRGSTPAPTTLRRLRFLLLILIYITIKPHTI